MDSNKITDLEQLKNGDEVYFCFIQSATIKGDYNTWENSVNLLVGGAHEVKYKIHEIDPLVHSICKKNPLDTIGYNFPKLMRVSVDRVTWGKAYIYAIDEGVAIGRGKVYEFYEDIVTIPKYTLEDLKKIVGHDFELENQ